MREFEKVWEEYKMPGDRISHKYAFKAGFVTALGWALGRIKNGSISYEQAHIEIEQELSNN
jgi:hypothetical protein